jgi:hypothetical protein
MNLVPTYQLLTKILTKKKKTVKLKSQILTFEGTKIGQKIEQKCLEEIT